MGELEKSDIEDSGGEAPARKPWSAPRVIESRIKQTLGLVGPGSDASGPPLASQTLHLS